MIDDLHDFALPVMTWPPDLPGYVVYTERYSAKYAVGKALIDLNELARSMAYLWFAYGYLSGLLGKDSPTVANATAVDHRAAREMLIWLRALQVATQDNDQPDTENLLYTVAFYVEAAQAGGESQWLFPNVREGKPFFAALADAPFCATPAEIQAAFGAAELRVAAFAYELGQQHRR